MQSLEIEPWAGGISSDVNMSCWVVKASAINAHAKHSTWKNTDVNGGGGDTEPNVISLLPAITITKPRHYA